MASPHYNQASPAISVSSWCYRRFIRDFSEIAHSLHHRFEQNAHFKWISENQKGFKITKTYLISAPVIAYTDFCKPFMIDTDASDTGIGAVLSQLDESSRECVIAYASILLSKLEQKYCVTG